MVRERVFPVVDGKVVTNPYLWLMKNLCALRVETFDSRPYVDKALAENEEFNATMFFTENADGVHLIYQASKIVSGKIQRIEKHNTYVGGKFTVNELDISALPNAFIINNYESIIGFASVVAEQNQYLVNAMLSANIPKVNYVSPETVRNLYVLCCKEQALFESYLKSNVNLLLSSLNSDIEFNKSIKATLGIPQKAIQTLEKGGFSDALMDLSALAGMVDGNDIVTIAEFIYKLRKTQGTTKNRRNQTAHQFLTNFIPLIKNGHQVSQALSYLVRQTYYYGNLGNMESMTNICRSFLDYDNMRISSGISSIEKYPQNIVYSERLLVYNSKSLNESLMEPFKEAVDKYRCFASDSIAVTMTEGKKKVKKEYVIIAPNTPQDLVAEGSALMHCVGTYGKLVAEGKSQIMFLRKKETPDESLITFEFDSMCNVTHATGMQNILPDEEQTLALKAWERYAKKIMKGDDK